MSSRHLTVEERQQQGADVRAVDVGVGHDDDLVVADLSMSKSSLPMPVPSAVIRVPISWLRQHLVEASPLDVEDLAAERQDRLEAAVAALLGGATGGVTLDDVDLAIARDRAPGSRRACRAGRHVERALATRQLARFARGLARRAASTTLATMRFASAGCSSNHSPSFSPITALDDRPDLGGDQLVLGLRGELRVGRLDGEHAGQAFARTSPVICTFSFLATPLSSE